MLRTWTTHPPSALLTLKTGDVPYGDARYFNTDPDGKGDGYYPSSGDGEYNGSVAAPGNGTGNGFPSFFSKSGDGGSQDWKDLC